MADTEAIKKAITQVPIETAKATVLAMTEISKGNRMLRTGPAQAS